MSRTAASYTERKRPPFTFFDGDRNRWRPQFPNGRGDRSHPDLRKADGSFVTDKADVVPAMLRYCRELADAGLPVPEEVAQFYLVVFAPPIAAETPPSSAEIIPTPLPPRAPPAEPERTSRTPAAPGWHGMDAMPLTADQKLIAELAPDFSAVHIGVAAGAPAFKAGLRTGDYVLAVGRYGNMVPLADFEALHLPAGLEVLVRFHRPGRRKAGQPDIETALLKLRRPAVAPKPRWWQLTPRAAPGPEVERDDRSRFEAEMARHPHLNPLGFRILVRLLRHYDGRHGAFPSYATLAADVGCKRRSAIENVRHLERLGLVEVLLRGGRVGFGGATNRFVLRWPEGWGVRR